MRAPDFWYPKSREHGDTFAQLLTPLGRLYDWGGRVRNAFAAEERVRLPVFCVGNLVAGGTGKTPVALALAERLGAAEHAPFFLTRGYGGRVKGPVLVDPAQHDAQAVGDEALLLAARAQTIVARKRAAGAVMAVAYGARALVMDDGFQNPHLHKDCALLTVDAETGFGNGALIPAGPLREPVERGLARATAVILMGEGQIPAELARSNVRIPLLRGRIRPDPEKTASLSGKAVVAFAGIGRPEKFFATLESIGCRLIHKAAFPDHHRYGSGEITRLKKRAADEGASLITTEKDYVRLPASQRSDIDMLPVHVAFDDEHVLAEIIARALEAFSASHSEATRSGGA